MGSRPNVTLHVLRWSAGLHRLTSADTMFLRGPSGQAVAWVETGYSGEPVQETVAVERLRLRYDPVRDLALSPDESRQFVEGMLEEAAVRAIDLSFFAASAWAAFVDGVKR